MGSVRAGLIGVVKFKMLIGVLSSRGAEEMAQPCPLHLACHLFGWAVGLPSMPPFGSQSAATRQPMSRACIFWDLAGYLVYFNSHRHHIGELQHQLGHNVTEHLLNTYHTYLTYRTPLKYTPLKYIPCKPTTPRYFKRDV